MIELLIIVACWLVSGVSFFWMGSVIDYLLYKGQKIEWKMIFLCMALGPIMMLVILRVLYETWMDRRGEKKPFLDRLEASGKLKRCDDLCKSSRPIRILTETDKCDWCGTKKAVITDGTYVYCSEECKKLFLENALEAIEENNG